MFPLACEDFEFERCADPFSRSDICRYKGSVASDEDLALVNSASTSFSLCPIPQPYPALDEEFIDFFVPFIVFPRFRVTGNGLVNTFMSLSLRSAPRTSGGTSSYFSESV